MGSKMTLFEQYTQWLNENVHLKKALRIARSQNMRLRKDDVQNPWPMDKKEEFRQLLRRAGFGHVGHDPASDYAGSSDTVDQFKGFLNRHGELKPRREQ
jgi:hypothetical protein